MNEIGCYGKIPAHGDFVWHGLPASFVTPWDQWLQRQLLELREALGDSWLDNYLQSNIWRFALNDATFGPGSWCGVIAPSVDLVGRYFPFTIAVNTAQNLPVITAMSELNDWFEHAETCLLDALQQAAPLENVLDSLRRQQLPSLPERDIHTAPSPNPWRIDDVESESWGSMMLEGIVYRQFNNPCAWETVSAEGARGAQITEGAESFGDLFLRGD